MELHATGQAVSTTFIIITVGGTAHTAKNAKSPLFPADRAGHKRLQIVRSPGSSDWEGAEKRSSKLDERHRFLDSTKSSKDATGRNIYQLFKEQIRFWHWPGSLRGNRWSYNLPKTYSGTDSSLNP